mgnify:CR=1 FL=1
MIGNLPMRGDVDELGRVVGDELFEFVILDVDVLHPADRSSVVDESHGCSSINVDFNWLLDLFTDLLTDVSQCSRGRSPRRLAKVELL